MLDAYCPHMGTHLARNNTSYVVQDGQIEGDSIRCPYHGWRFGPDGKLYAAPFYGESSMVMYRTDLFQKAGLTMPENPSWDFVIDAANKLTGTAEFKFGARPRFDGVLSARQIDFDQLAGTEAPGAARHQDLDVTLEAMQGAFVVDVVRRLVVARRQHQVEQLDAARLQQARADRAAEIRAERPDADDVEGLGVGQSHRRSPCRRRTHRPMHRPWGIRTACFKDPAGHIWEIAK